MYRLLVFCTVFLGAAAAAGAESVKLTSTEVITMALANNNRIKAATYHSRAVRQGVESDRSRYFPAVMLEEALVGSNSPTSTFMMKLDEGRFTAEDFRISALNNPSATHDFKTAVSVQQPIYVPSLAPLMSMAVQDARKSELELEAAREGVAFQAFHLYLEVRKADAQVTAAEKAVVEARESMRLATVRTASGIGLKSDELRARTQLSLVEQQLITAHNNRMLSRMKLAMVIGLPEGDDFQVSDLSEPVAVPEISDPVMVAALENRVEIKQSHIDLEKSDAAFMLARSEYLPTVGAFASYQLNAKDVPFTSDNSAWNAGLSLKWQLFDGFRRDSEGKRAALGQSAAREQLESATKDVRYQVRESYVRRDEAAKRLEVSRNSVLFAEETVRLLSRRFENSLALMVELLDAQTVLNQARANLVDAEAGYALAGGRVYFMTGSFIKEMHK
jgi:outer membrane protein TolC